jgi:hypothetical protein
MSTVKKTGKAFKDCFRKNHDFAALLVAFRDAGTNLAEAASRVIRSTTNPNVDGIHRLALAVTEWYQTVADERKL